MNEHMHIEAVEVLFRWEDTGELATWFTAPDQAHAFVLGARHELPSGRIIIPIRKRRVVKIHN